MWWGLIRCRMKRKTVCVGVECVFEKLCFRLSEVEGGKGAGRWKGILCLYYLFPSFLSAGFYLLRVLFPHFFHFESFLSHLLPLSLIQSSCLPPPPPYVFIVDAKIGFSAFSWHLIRIFFLLHFFVVAFGEIGVSWGERGVEKNSINAKVKSLRFASSSEKYKNENKLGKNGVICQVFLK